MRANLPGHRRKRLRNQVCSFTRHGLSRKREARASARNLEINAAIWETPVQLVMSSATSTLCFGCMLEVCGCRAQGSNKVAMVVAARFTVRRAASSGPAIRQGTAARELYVRASGLRVFAWQQCVLGTFPRGCALYASTTDMK